MTQPEALTNEELSAIADRAKRVDPYRKMMHKSLTQVAIDSANDVPTLLAEIERYRANIPVLWRYPHLLNR